MDRTQKIFENKISEKVIKKANKSKAKFYKKFGDDSKASYHMALEDIKTLNHLNISNLVQSNKPLVLPEKSVVIGNIRMGFGHYRIAIALASCANALGYKPLWFDLSGFPESTGSKIVTYQNNLYSMGSRWSQKYKLFNKFWDIIAIFNFVNSLKEYYIENNLDYNIKDYINPQLKEEIFEFNTLLNNFYDIYNSKKEDSLLKLLLDKK